MYVAVKTLDLHSKLAQCYLVVDGHLDLEVKVQLPVHRLGEESRCVSTSADKKMLQQWAADGEFTFSKTPCHTYYFS